MAIPDHARTNFNTLLRAAGDGNPYDLYLPPDPDDPAGFIENPEDGGAS